MQHTYNMISSSTELVAEVLSDLPPDVRTVMEAHFLDGESVFKIQRRYKLKRRDLEALIEAALVTMRTALRSRGVLGMAEVI